jgi:hypothetical protein
LRKIQNREVPAQLVELEKTELSKIVNKFNNLNINNMENGLNFGKPLRLLRQAKRVARAGWNRQNVHIVPASQYPAITGCKRILGRRKLCTLSRILGS